MCKSLGKYVKYSTFSGNGRKRRIVVLLVRKMRCHFLEMVWNFQIKFLKKRMEKFMKRTQQVYFEEDLQYFHNMTYMEPAFNL